MYDTQDEKHGADLHRERLEHASHTVDLAADPQEEADEAEIQQVEADDEQAVHGVGEPFVAGEDVGEERPTISGERAAYPEGERDADSDTALPSQDTSEHVQRPIRWFRQSVVWHGVELVGVGVGFATTLAAAKQGDEHAFIALFRPLQPRLLWYFRTLGREHAEDLAAETWLKVAHGLDRFEGDEYGFRAWVFAIARTRRADRMRAEGKEPEFVTLAAVDEADMPVERSAEDVVDERAATERALRLIAGLSPDEAEVLTLRLVAGLDVARTAAIVGKRPGTVRVLAHRGLRKLGQALGQVAPAHAGVRRNGDGE